MNEYYVYALMDPRNNEIFYIGKGKNNRYLDHIKDIKELEKEHSLQKKGINPNKTRKIKEIVELGYELKYKFIAENLTENEAFVLEEVLIERFGREVLKNGKLLNLEPGGKWEYPKLMLSEEEKTSIETIKANYPNLIDIIKDYPHIATENKLKPWWTEKIPKRFAIYKYSLNGNYLETHHSSQISHLGLNGRIIEKCIDQNAGYAYEYQWSKEKLEKMPNLELLSQEELLKLHSFTRWIIREVSDKEQAEHYKNRNQEEE